MHFNLGSVLLENFFSIKKLNQKHASSNNLQKHITFPVVYDEIIYLR